MNLVDDVHLPAASGRLEAHVVPQVPDVVYAPVRGRVDLDQVQHPVLVDGDAVLAGVVRLAVRRVEAVQGLGQYAGGRRLAHAARAGEEVGVGHAAGRDGAPKCAGYVVLSRYLAETLRPPLTVEDLRGLSHTAASGPAASGWNAFSSIAAVMPVISRSSSGSA